VFKYIVLLLTILVAFCSAASTAQEGFGIGIIIGEPTGISFKNWLSPTRAVDGAAAWSFEGNDALHLHADYLFHNGNLAKVEGGQLLLYYGLGARLKLQDHSRFGVRIPFGAAYLLRASPLDFFLEIVPIMDLAPDTELEFNGGFGIRLYFK
jgi:hypothetical protein